MHRIALAIGVICLGISTLVHSDDTIEIASGVAPDHPQQPQLAIDPSGTVHAVYGANNRIFYSRLPQGDKSFQSPVALPTTGVISLGMRRGPRIAVAGKSICVSIIGGQQGKGRDGDLLAFHSTDGGQDWSGPVPVNDIAASAREGLHAMAAGPNEQLCCVWLDLRSKKTEIFAAVSVDGGATWGQNRLVYRSPDGSVCECCHPSVAFDARGTLHVMWRNSLADARDMYLVNSSDGGKTFGEATKLGTGTWPLKACPMDGGFLAISPQGKVTTTWRRDNQIFLARPEESEQQLGIGRQPWIAATSSGSHILWVSQRNGKLLYLAPRQKAPVELSNTANDPVIVAGADGSVTAAWEERRDEKSVLLGRRIAGE